MKSREEVMYEFCKFVKENELSASELLIVMDCCVREMSAKKTINTCTAKQMGQWIKEQNGD